MRTKLVILFIISSLMHQCRISINLQHQQVCVTLCFFKILPCCFYTFVYSFHVCASVELSSDCYPLNLRSLKLGLMPGPTAFFGSSQPCIYSTRNSPEISGFSWNDKRSRQGKESCILSRSCLSSLGSDNGAPG